jgi:predicted dehydrogenase
MKNDKLKIGVVGVGHLGRLHAMQLKQVPEAEFVGIYDLDANRAAEVGQEFGIPVFDDFPGLLEAADAISIVTPTSTHFEYAEKALRANRHTFIEKPMTETLEQADELIRLSRERKLKIQIGHIERFNPAIIALEPLQINPLFIEAHRMANFNPRGTDVAVVLDLMIHDIDLILSFVKSPVKELHASGASIISPTEDIANCRLEFENGCVANVTASRISARKMRKMRFFQPNAYVSVDFLEGLSEVYYLDRGEYQFNEKNLAFSLGQIEHGTEKKEIRYTRLEKADINPLRYELQLFCRSVLEDTPPPVTAEDGRRALNIAKRILSSIEGHTQLVKKHWKIQ